MTDKKELAVTEGNKLIAEFMGWQANRFKNLPNKLHKEEEDVLTAISIDHLEYHSSWDLLMPVWEKFRMNVWQTTGYTKEFDEWKEGFMRAVFNNSCHSAAMTMANAIKWYNNQTPTK